MATHLGILVWRIPWTEEPGGLQSTGSQSQTWLKQLSMHAYFYIYTSSNCVGNSAPWETYTRNRQRADAFSRPLFNATQSVLRLVAQSCPTLCDPMDCSSSGSSIHRDSPGKKSGVGGHALLQGNLPNPGLLYCRWVLYQLSYQEH